MMNRNMMSALGRIPVAEVDRGTWIAVGMALKHEGYPVGVWDEWSRNDQRYHPGSVRNCGRDSMDATNR